MVGGPYNKNGGGEDPKKDPKWNLLQNKTSGKTKNQMGGRCPERCIAIIRNEKMEEKRKKWWRVQARFEGGQGPEGAVAPIDGWMISSEIVYEPINVVLSLDNGQLDTHLLYLTIRLL